jgi:hypothetical protein
MIIENKTKPKEKLNLKENNIFGLYLLTLFLEA